MKPGVYKVEMSLPVAESEVPGALEARAARAVGVRPEDVTGLAVERRALDARKGRPIVYRLRVAVAVGGAVLVERPPRKRPARVATRERVVVAGSGPAGTFCALRLAEAGAQVTVCELGKAVQPRRRDLAKLVRRGELDPDSNYCFGEGGAGTFSDGKLYTRTKDRDAIDEVLDVLVESGADPAIRVESRPHIGSNRLPQILVGLRRTLESLGVEYRFSDPVEDVIVEDGAVTAVELRSGVRLSCTRFVMAVGHSARGLYERLVARGVLAGPKPFAVGARVEHPQPLVDAIQYGEAARECALPAAFYHITANVPAGDGTRGVYSFCMCPGGWIVDSSTEPGRLCTNGMSLKRRDSPHANAALVVTLGPADMAAFARYPGDPLAGVELQRRIEEAGYELGGGGFVAPAQRLTDFVAGRASSAALPSSYRPGVAAADLGEALPGVVVDGLRAAVPVFERTMRGFLTDEAQLVGVETRSSAPVRFLRDRDTCESPTHRRLYPCGEGAGYAGGIVSAAIDGFRVADAILRDR